MVFENFMFLLATENICTCLGLAIPLASGYRLEDGVGEDLLKSERNRVVK